MAANVDGDWRSLFGFGGSLWLQGLFFRSPDAVLLEHGEPFAMQVEVHQGEVRAQPVVVLRDAPIAYLVEVEDALQDTEDMFYFRPHVWLIFIFLLL